MIVPYLKGTHLFGYVDRTLPAPPTHISSTENNQTHSLPNPAFHSWHLQDQLILSALISSLTENFLSHVVKCTTSRDVWLALERMFSSTFHARITHIHFQLATLKTANLSIADYFQQFTNLTDTLAAVDQPLNNYELVYFLLAGLGLDYDSFVTSVTTKGEPLSLEDLYGHLLAHEKRLEQHQAAVDLTVANANFTSRNTTNCGGRGNRRSSPSHDGRGHYQNSPSRNY
ncbi:hypothetical protein F0562_026078 [Nyssa sinensis]|uniref:Uncharacterized protein n=1 Tax=Nyssa sinensis TaxID=561372 RepID=A0A5J5BAI4_9ASTE|nr:hypothetical protein F0562_026078 [Nyssa sinensis]